MTITDCYALYKNNELIFITENVCEAEKIAEEQGAEIKKVRFAVNVGRFI